jgi:MoxR-like ATPase
VKSLDETRTIVRQALDELDRVVVGKRDAIELVLLTVLAGGHVLLEDVPGTGKTLMARAVARVLGLDFARVQFTPDLLPSDLTGAPALDPATRELAFRPGPVFTNVLLADELNRTPPKTQAALLEAMGEYQVSSDGVTRRLPEPFVVLATDNPIEYEGTFPLPEAQLDRFTARLRIGYLAANDESAMVRRSLDHNTDPAILRPIADPAKVVEMVRSMDGVEVHDDVTDYVVALVNATRRHPSAEVGASPRGSLALTRLARGAALVDGRDYVTPDDVKRVAVAALGHRITVKAELWVRNITGDAIVEDVLGSVPTPTVRPSRPMPSAAAASTAGPSGPPPDQRQWAR